MFLVKIISKFIVKYYLYIYKYKLYIQNIYILIDFLFLSSEMKDYSIYLTLSALNYKLIVNLDLLLGVIKIQIINHDINFT